MKISELWNDIELMEVMIAPIKNEDVKEAIKENDLAKFLFCIIAAYNKLDRISLDTQKKT
jgi:hypothetical protein